MRKTTIQVNKVKAQTHTIKESRHFPNNTALPLVYYPKAISIDEGDADTVEEIFKSNNWHDTWRSDIYKQHHYHSTAHEVLGIYKGCAKVQFGGPEGIIQ